MHRATRQQAPTGLDIAGSSLGTEKSTLERLCSMAPSASVDKVVAGAAVVDVPCCRDAACMLAVDARCRAVKRLPSWPSFVSVRTSICLCQQLQVLSVPVADAACQVCSCHVALVPVVDRQPRAGHLAVVGNQLVAERRLGFVGTDTAYVVSNAPVVWHIC